MMKSTGMIIIIIWVSLLYGKMKFLVIVKFKMVSAERHQCFKRCYISRQFVLKFEAKINSFPRFYIYLL